MNGTNFFVRFPTANILGGAYGTWFNDETETVHYYYINDSGEVGRIIYEKRTTHHTYSLITGEDAEMVKSYYRK